MRTAHKACLAHAPNKLAAHDRNVPGKCWQPNACPSACRRSCQGHNLPERSARARCAGAAAAGRSLGISPACWRSGQTKQEEEEQSGLGWHAIRLTIERPKAPLSRATNSRKASQAGRRWPRQYNWSDALILAINRLGRSGSGANWRGRRRPQPSASEPKG